jgi:hypothetical protein
MSDNGLMRDQAWRKAVLDYVKPLAVGMDGATNFGDVERIVRAAEAIAADHPAIRSDALFLLAAFSGQARWVLRAGHGSRTELFLSSIGCEPAEIGELFRALARYASSPQTAEERVVHDARRLEETGAYGLARLLSEAARGHMDFEELCGEVQRAARAEFETEEGRRLAAPRLELMKTFAESLAREYAAFAPSGSGGAKQARSGDSAV